MIIFKIIPVFLIAIAVRADKKIELQDIEEDNLKSEKEKEYDVPNQHIETGVGSSPVTPLDFLKGGFLRYFENPHQAPQPARYVHQYSVTEAPERPPPVSPPPKPHFLPSAPGPQQAMVGYLSNVPMQIYLVPQYYNEGSEASASGHNGVQYTASPSGARAAPYPTAPESVQPQNNYIEVPAYAGPTSKTYVQQYTQNVPAPVAYVGYSAQPTIAPTAPPTATPVQVTYQIPVVQYQAAAVVAQQQASKGHYYQPQHYTETNAVEEVQETVDENPKQYEHTEVTYEKVPAAQFPRYYTSRPPLREEFRHSHITELPHPSALLLKPHPSHLAHIPKALPSYRPVALSKPIYGPSNHIPGPLLRPSEPFGVPPFKRRPTSLLDSYVPSSVQVEYMKRGYTNDPLVAYEALSSGRHFSHSHLPPRHYERGFLPNQMYHTAAGGVTFGHYKKRTPKADKPTHNQ